MIENKTVTAPKITFRRIKGGGLWHLIPMVDGIDIPNVTCCVLQQNVGDCSVSITVLLPDGVLVE